MATFIITYDLTQPGRNYNDMYARIRHTHGHTYLSPRGP